MFREKIILFLALILAGVTGHAQTLNLHWAKQIGSTSSDAGFSITTDKSGNVYTAGNFRGNVDLDPGNGTFMLHAFGSDDIFISRLDATGNFVWAKQLGGVDFDNGSAVTIDNQGNIYVAGFFQGTSDFDPGTGVFNMSSNGSNDMFIVKLNPSGNFVWAKQIGGASSDMCLSVAADSLGNAYMGGYFIGAVDFDPGAAVFNLASKGAQDAFIAKLDASGNFVWARQMGGSLSDLCNSITVDAYGNSYLTGSFMGQADFDPGNSDFILSSAGFLDVFVSKLDTSGNFVWARQMGSATRDDQGYSIAADRSGNVYTTGNFNDTADFDPGPGVFNLISRGSSDIFVSKLNAAGALLWARQMGGPSDDGGSAIALDTSGNAYATGSFGGTGDFDPGPGTANLTSDGMYDIFISKLSGAGNFVWAEQMGGDSLDNALAIALDRNGDVVTTGYFTSSCDFNPGSSVYSLTSAGRYDIFIAKLGAGVSGISDAQQAATGNSLTMFPNPTSGMVNIAFKDPTENSALKLISITGQTVMEKQHLNGTEFVIDISELAGGIYFLEVTEARHVSRVKLVKN